MHYCTRCRADGKNQKNAIAQSMGDAWIVHAIFWRIGMFLRKNAHVGVLVPEYGPLPP